MDDATSEQYSMFFVAQEGTASSLMGVQEVIEKRGLFDSFYSDRGSHYWFTPKEGGKVTIEVAVSPEWVIVGVRDTGIGISKEDLPRVWERFFQTKEAQTMRKAGFGLGLKISREIVQMHGGDMGIESELGVGSFFFFKLPIPKTQASAAPAPPAA